ncbi:MAG: HAD family hydrolase [Porcipelethomonas sp.]
MANIILDFDGTIHDCAKIYVPAFRVGYKYLTDKGLMEYREYPDSEIISYLGYTPKAMWENFAPDIADSEKKTVTKIVSDEMTKMTENGQAVLYNGAEEALQKLSDSGHRLIFLSNCLHSYMELHRRVHRLDRFYTDYLCSEDFGYISKPEIFSSIKDKYSGEYIIVGDRCFDLETAWEHGLKSIGCLYGYCQGHELDRASALITDISQLPEAVDKLLEN